MLVTKLEDLLAALLCVGKWGRMEQMALNCSWFVKGRAGNKLLARQVDDWVSQMSFPLPGSFYDPLIWVASYLSGIKGSLNDPSAVFLACEYLLSCCYCISYHGTFTTFERNVSWGKALVSKFIVTLYQPWLAWALRGKLTLNPMEV